MDIDQLPRSEEFGKIGTYSFEEQEELMIDDLIWCLLGKSGEYICVEGTSTLTSREYVIDPSLGKQSSSYFSLHYFFFSELGKYRF